MARIQNLSPNKEGYSVPLIAGKSFSGYQVLAYYYVSWAKAFPEYLEHLQLLGKEYEFALEMVGMGEFEFLEQLTIPTAYRFSYGYSG